jgi:hypothetical protein
MLRPASAICVPAKNEVFLKKIPNRVARTYQKSSSKIIFPVTIRAERRVELTLFTFQGHFGFFFFAEPRNAYSSQQYIWAETACSMLQEKAFFEFQIHLILIQSPTQ